MLMMMVAVLVGIMSVVGSHAMRDALLQQHTLTWDQAHRAVNEAAMSAMERQLNSVVSEGVAQLPSAPGGYTYQLNHVTAVTTTEYCGIGEVSVGSGSDAQWFASHQYMTTVVAEVTEPGVVRVLDQQFWQYLAPRDGQTTGQSQLADSSNSAASIVCLEYTPD